MTNDDMADLAVDAFLQERSMTVDEARFRDKVLDEVGGRSLIPAGALLGIAAALLVIFLAGIALLIHAVLESAGPVVYQKPIVLPQPQPNNRNTPTPPSLPAGYGEEMSFQEALSKRRNWLAPADARKKTGPKWQLERDSVNMPDGKTTDTLAPPDEVMGMKVTHCSGWQELKHSTMEVGLRTRVLSTEKVRTPEKLVTDRAAATIAEQVYPANYVQIIPLLAAQKYALYKEGERITIQAINPNTGKTVTVTGWLRAITPTKIKVNARWYQWKELHPSERAHFFKPQQAIAINAEIAKLKAKHASQKAAYTKQLQADIQQAGTIVLQYLVDVPSANTGKNLEMTLTPPGNSAQPIKVSHKFTGIAHEKGADLALTGFVVISPSQALADLAEANVQIQLK